MLCDNSRPEHLQQNPCLDSPLLGHLVSAGEQYGEHGYIKCLGGRKADDQLQYLLHS
jgi:hypothetical protein